MRLRQFLSSIFCPLHQPEKWSFKAKISKEDCTSATHVYEVAYKESTEQVEDNVKNILITHETVKATVDNCQNLYKIMCITDLEQNLFKFSIEEKQGLPMYEEIEMRMRIANQMNSKGECSPRVTNQGELLHLLNTHLRTTC